MRQNGHVAEFTERYAKTRADYDRTPVKPVIDGEPIYEDHPVSFKPEELGHSTATDVRRPLRVTLQAQDVTGKKYTKAGEGLLARAFCHETDHLHGKLFISHLSVLKRDLIRRKVRKLVKAGEW
jgi:hypothetical protein